MADNASLFVEYFGWIKFHVLREALEQGGCYMSGYFDGRNGRLSKTLGDLRDLGDLQFEEICWNWSCWRFTWQFMKSF